MIFSHDSEASVVTTCLLNVSAIDECADIVKPNDFYVEIYRDSWAWMIDQAAAGKEVDVIGLHEHLSSKHSESAYGGLSGLADLVRTNPASPNVLHYAKAVKDKSNRRKMQALAAEIESMASDNKQEFSSIVDVAQAKVAGLLEGETKSSGLVSDWIKDWLDQLDAKYNGLIDPMGLKYGIPELDDLTNGMHKKDLILIAGESGMGKTVVASHILDSVCLRQNEPAVMFQLEMDKEPVLNRVIGSFSGIKLDALKNPRMHMDDEGWAKLAPAFQKVSKAPLVIDDRPGLTMSQIRGASKRWKQHFGRMGCIIIDHTGIVGAEDKRAPREQQISEIVKACKVLAKDLDCPVFLLAQINRDNKVRKDKRPIMSDLRESAALEHNADVAIFIYREAKYNPECENPGIAELIIGKQRDGAVGTVKVVCDLTRSQLKPLTAENISSYSREFPRIKTEDAEGFQL